MEYFFKALCPLCRPDYVPFFLLVIAACVIWLTVEYFGE